MFRGLLMGAATLLTPIAAAEVQLSGVVQSTTRTPVASARVVLDGQPGGPWTAVSDISGEFSLTLPAAGKYQLSVEHPGFFPIKREIATGAGLIIPLDPVRELIQSLEVTSTPDTIDMETTAVKRSVGSPEILNVPYPNTNDFRSALRIIPGMIRDHRGGLHLQGGSEEQTLYTLNGFNLNDPLSGRFDTRFSVEAVQSAEISSGNLPAEFGKGSAGVLAIRTHTGDDRFRPSATNFVPGFENRKGWTLTDWTPRFGVSGPIARGRAWFSNSTDIIYTKTIIRDLPKGDDRSVSHRGSNMLSTQVNLSPRHILHTGLLWSQWSAARTGLSALDPWETTIDRRSRQWFFHAKDQIYLSRGALLEVGFAANRTFGREVPQGSEPLVFTPFGKRGNHFADAGRGASRDQILVNAFLPGFTRAGSHQVRVGTDLNRVRYEQDVRRTGYGQLDGSGTRLYHTEFHGSGRFARRNFESAWYVQDSWRVIPSLLVEAGLRADWDTLVRSFSPSPRLGLAWSPGKRNTKVYGGISRTFDATSLLLFTRPMDQYWLTTHFFPDGRINRGPGLSLFTIGANHRPRPHYDGLSAGVEHHWGAGISVRADYLQRRGGRGFTYVNSNDSTLGPVPDWVRGAGASALDAVFDLTNLRRDSFRSYSVTLRQILRKQYQWMTSYTFSRALSNAVVDVNADDPLTAVSNSGPMPWDSPHRLVSWGYLPLPRKNWAVAFLLDGRSGFPFSVRNQIGEIDGPVNARRFPTYFEANLHLERRFEFRRHMWALRFGANNLTNRVNPDTVNNIIGSPRYLQFHGGNGRSTNFRIRWLGRAAR